MVNAAAIILAGGKNSRMGGASKALLEIDDRRLIQRIIDELSGEFPEIIVVTNEPEKYSELGVVLTRDIIPGRGPLSGIHAGLTASSYRLNLVTACDMPFINGPLAAFMVKNIGDADALVPRIDNKWQQLFAVYSRDCLPAISESLEGERTKFTSFFPKVRVKYFSEETVREFCDPDRLFFNVNTPDELVRARSMASEEGYHQEIKISGDKHGPKNQGS